jgi:hypothetical protein
MSRWHLEAGIACEHAIAPSIRETDWDRIVGLYEVLAQQYWSPVVALNRALAASSSRWPTSRSCPATPSTGRPGPIWNGESAATTRPGTTMSAPSRWPGARPSECPSSGGSRA